MTDGVFNANPDPVVDDNIDPVIAKRLTDKDAYIAQLEMEAAEKLAAIEAKEVELEAARLLREAREKTVNPPPSNAATPAAKEPAIDTDALVERVLEAQTKRGAEAQAKANVAAVGDRMTELYGSVEAANKLVKARADELGVGVDFLLSTASKSPAAFYDLMKLETAPKQDAAPRGDVNPAALKNHAPGVKPGTPEYYEQLRKEIGDVAFFKPHIQQQRFEDMKKLRNT